MPPDLILSVRLTVVMIIFGDKMQTDAKRNKESVGHGFHRSMMENNTTSVHQNSKGAVSFIFS